MCKLYFNWKWMPSKNIPYPHQAVNFWNVLIFCSKFLACWAHHMTSAIGVKVTQITEGVLLSKNFLCVFTKNISYHSPPGTQKQWNPAVVLAQNVLLTSVRVNIIPSPTSNAQDCNKSDTSASFCSFNGTK